LARPGVHLAAGESQGRMAGEHLAPRAEGGVRAIMGQSSADQSPQHANTVGRRGRAGAGAARTDPGGRTTARTQGWARAWRNCGRRRTESGQTQTCKGGQLVVAGMLGWDDRRASRVLGPQAVRSEMRCKRGSARRFFSNQAKAGHRSRNRRCAGCGSEALNGATTADNRRSEQQVTGPKSQLSTRSAVGRGRHAGLNPSSAAVYCPCTRCRNLHRDA
jgi:hypothetical protein